MEPAALVSQNPKINWQYLYQSLEHYQSLGYMYLELPWTVPKEITKITFPQRDKRCETVWGDPVGSAEQSFLWHEKLGMLEKGKFCALTPCFRLEPEHNSFSRPYFMKVELYQNTNLTEKSLQNIIEQCLNWYKQLAPHVNFEIIKTQNGYDINGNNIELGSYGFREHHGHKWLFATGLAEPRFSVVQNL